MATLPSREDALDLFNEYNTSESLKIHALCVEGVMRYFAELFGEDTEKWSLVGLIHDLDYDKFPEQHCRMSEKILKEKKWENELIRAVVSHGWGICSDVEPLSQMEKTLFAIDELTGLIHACALVRPSKSISDLEVKSVLKKWKIKSFAAGANRDLILKGAEMMCMDINILIEHTINGMRRIANTIGLK